MTTIRVVVAEDDVLLRSGVVALLRTVDDVEVVGEAGSLPELMTAATAYLNIVENRTSVSRGDIVEVVQQIAGDIPLTAEAKVKAVGKLVRAGTLVRLDGGQFMLDEVETQRFRDRMDGAA